MSYYGEVKIKDQFGWERTVELEKPLALIGSSPSSDICLPEGHGGGVAPIHLQLICSGTTEESFRLFNISDLQVSIMEQASGFEVPLMPGSARLIGKEDVLRIGDFLLDLNLLTSEAVVNQQRTENIGMSLELPAITLYPGEKLSGLLSVKNYGARKRCQFEIDLNGLPDDCYQIAPAPLLYPGAEEKLLIRFFHRRTRPAAGPCEIIIRATAAASYPTEQILIRQTLNVQPVFNYRLEMEEEEQEMEPAAEVIPVQKKPVRIQAVNPDVEEPQPIVVAAADIPRSSRTREAAAAQDVWAETEVETTAETREGTTSLSAQQENLEQISSEGESELKSESSSVGQSKQGKKLFPKRDTKLLEKILDQYETQSAQEFPEKQDILELENLKEPENLEETDETFEQRINPEPAVIIEELSAPEEKPELVKTADLKENDKSEEINAPEQEEDGSEDDWWNGDDDFQSSLGKRSSLNSFNRNVRSRLTSDEIQVIRASRDDEDNAAEMEQE